MTFAHATAWDGLPFLLAGLYLTWLGFRRIPDRMSQDPGKLRRYQSFREVYRFAGPGLSVTSLLFMLAKATMQ
jgi:hypothetical protein